VFKTKQAKNDSVTEVCIRGKCCERFAKNSDSIERKGLVPTGEKIPRIYLLSLVTCRIEQYGYHSQVSISNSLSPDMEMHILRTALYTFCIEVVRRIF